MENKIKQTILFVNCDLPKKRKKKEVNKVQQWKRCPEKKKKLSGV